MNKLATFPLYQKLNNDNQVFLQQLSNDYRFTHQELNQLIQISADLTMWREDSLSSVWQQLKQKNQLLH